MLSRNEFAVMLKTRYVPHYAFPRFEPKELPKYFKFAVLQTKRVVKSGAISSEEIVRVSPRTQGTIYRTLAKLKTISPYIIAISSYPNEYLATECAACIQLELMRTNPDLRWMWCTTAFDPSKGDRKEDNPQLVVLRSIIPSTERLHNVLDILNAYPKAMRIVCLSDVSAFDYFDNYIHYPLSGAINIMGTVEKMPPQLFIKSSKAEEVEHHAPSFIEKDISKLVKYAPVRTDID